MLSQNSQRSLLNSDAITETQSAHKSKTILYIRVCVCAADIKSKPIKKAGFLYEPLQFDDLIVLPINLIFCQPNGKTAAITTTKATAAAAKVL